MSAQDLEEGELKFGLPAALVVLLLVFGTVVAGLAPLLMRWWRSPRPWGLWRWAARSASASRVWCEGRCYVSRRTCCR